MQQRSQMFIVFFLILPLISIAQLSQEQADKIDKIFAKWNQEDKPGCALSVIKDGTILYQKAYGMADLEHDIPINSKSIFYIGSVSKQFVAMCMLLLEEQGKVDLDEDIRTYLPEFPDYGHAISIRNLIHHTSGIRDNLTLWELAGRSHLDEISEAEIYELIMRQEQLNFEPGTEYRYSNSCYFMMSLIVERVTNQSLREYAAEHIFQPLGMKYTFFGDDNRRIIKNRAFGYGTTPDGSIENMIMRFDLVGSGGLYSNVEDLFLWDQNFYDNKLGARGQALIDDMLTNGRFKDGTEVDYAFALVNGKYKGLPTISHSGSLGGYRAYYVRFPEEQFSVVILGNVTTLGPGSLAYSVVDICLQKQLSAAPKNQVDTIAENQLEHKSETVEIKDLSIYTGRYYSPELDFHYKMEIENNQLFMKIGEVETHLLNPISKSGFLMQNGWDVKFQWNAQGKIKGFILNAGWVSGLRFERVGE